MRNDAFKLLIIKPHFNLFYWNQNIRQKRDYNIAKPEVFIGTFLLFRTRWWAFKIISTIGELQNVYLLQIKNKNIIGL